MMKVMTRKKITQAQEAHQEQIDELTAQRGVAHLEIRELSDALVAIQRIALSAETTGLNDNLEALDVAKILRLAEKALGSNGRFSPFSGHQLPEEWRTSEDAKS